MQQKGFTLIELLVAISILFLLMGLGIVNYIRFNDRQQLIQSAQQLREAIFDAQNSARSGKLRGCNRLDSYRVDFDDSTIVITPRCWNNAGAIDSDQVQQFEVSASISGDSLYLSPIKGLIYDDQLMNDQNQSIIGPFNLSVENNAGVINIVVQHTGSIIIGEIE